MKVNENDPPGPISPLSHTSVSLLEVCVRPAVLVQVTVVPTFTVRPVGLKKLSPMATAALLGGHVGVGLGVNVGVFVRVLVGVLVLVGVKVGVGVPASDQAFM